MLNIDELKKNSLFVFLLFNYLFNCCNFLIAQDFISKDDLQKADDVIIKHFPNLSKSFGQADDCVRCHPDHLRQVSNSIHGKIGLLERFPPGSICLTCHAVNHHTSNYKETDDKFLVLARSISEKKSCIKCHSDPVISEIFQFPIYVPSQFELSMHYRKAMLGDSEAPLCADCHGNHSILKTKDPNSPFFKITTRVKICAKCHPRANENFTRTFDHLPITFEHKPIEFIVIAAFNFLILTTFLMLGFFMLLDLIAIIRKILFRSQKVDVQGESSTEYVERLNLSQRWQHFLLFASYIILVLTGWPLLAPKSPDFTSVINGMGGIRWFANIHKTAGFVMIFTFIYHLYYLFKLSRSGAKIKAFPLLPKRKDFVDLGHLFLFFLGVKKKRPSYEQFAFFEKFDYWAVCYGVPLMGVTGIILMFPTELSYVFPAWVIKVSEIAHAYEALLAGVVLMIWHLYNVHLKPGIFPMNWAWLTGRMTKKQYEKEHRAHVNYLKDKRQW